MPLEVFPRFAPLSSLLQRSAMRVFIDTLYSRQEGLGASLLMRDTGQKKQQMNAVDSSLKTSVGD